MENSGVKEQYRKPEPVYNLHFVFKNHSNPMIWYQKNIGEIADILKEWSENWIIEPAELPVTRGLLCYSLFGDTYFLHFILREKNE